MIKSTTLYLTQSRAYHIMTKGKKKTDDTNDGLR